MDELPLWIAWSGIEPFGREADDISRAWVGAKLLHAWGGKETLDDMIPKYESVSLPPEVAKEVAEASWLGFIEQHNRRYV